MAQLEHGTHALFTASVVLHELSYGIHRLAAGRRRERLGGAQLAQPAMSSTPTPRITPAERIFVAGHLGMVIGVRRSMELVVDADAVLPRAITPSPTFGKWVGAELNAKNHHQPWIPVGLTMDSSPPQPRCSTRRAASGTKPARAPSAWTIRISPSPDRRGGDSMKVFSSSCPHQKQQATQLYANSAYEAHPRSRTLQGKRLPL